MVCSKMCETLQVKEFLVEIQWHLKILHGVVDSTVSLLFSSQRLP